MKAPFTALSTEKWKSRLADVITGSVTWKGTANSADPWERFGVVAIHFALGSLGRLRIQAGSDATTYANGAV